MRHAFHITASIAMWVLFAYYWRIVLGRGVDPDALRAVGTLGLTVLIGLVITLLWVQHNLRLARKFAGRRRQAPNAPPPALAEDTIGRTVVRPELDALRQATVVDIDADAEQKRYVVEPVAVTS